MRTVYVHWQNVCQLFNRNYLSLGQASSYKLIQMLQLIHMFIIYVVRSYRRVFQRFLLGCNWSRHGAIGIALSYPHRVRVRATVKLSATFFHDEPSTTKGGYESAIALYSVSSYLVLVSYLFYHLWHGLIDLF